VRSYLEATISTSPSNHSNLTRERFGLSVFTRFFGQVGTDKLVVGSRGLAA
jgi:hypothetical protein